MSADIANEQTRLSKANRELEPGARRVEVNGLQAANELARVLERPGLEGLVATDLWIQSVLEQRLRVAGNQRRESQAPGENLGRYQCQLALMGLADPDQTAREALPNVGFSCEVGWRGPCPARGVTSGFVCWKRLLGRFADDGSTK